MEHTLNKAPVPTLYAQQIDIMRRFDFARVLKAMHALNWTWMGKTVDIADLEKTATYLMDSVIRSYEESKDGWRQAATGGFAARVNEMAAGPQLNLSFHIDDVSAYLY